MNEKELQRINQQAARVGMDAETTVEAFRRFTEMFMPTSGLADMQEALSLKEKTGAGIQNCKRAIKYAKVHDGCTPLGYLKAITYAVATRGISFEERVRMFSDRGEAE